MYTVQVEGFILGTYRKPGETIRLTEAQAKTFLREGRIEANGQPRLMKSRNGGKTEHRPVAAD